MLVSWGVWWTWNMRRRFRASLEPAGPPFRSSPYFSADCTSCLPHWFEPAAKLLCPLCPFLLTEQLQQSVLFPDGSLSHWWALSMVHTFGSLAVSASGLVDLQRLRRPELPPVDSAFLVGALFVNGFAFHFHTFGPVLDSRLHLMLAYACYAASAASAWSCASPHSVTACFARCVALLTMGSMWMQTGDTIYHRPAFDNETGAMLAPTMLCAHLTAWALVLVFALSSAVPQPQKSSAGGISP